MCVGWCWVDTLTSNAKRTLYPKNAAAERKSESVDKAFRECTDIEKGAALGMRSVFVFFLFTIILFSYTFFFIRLKERYSIKCISRPYTLRS